jgi:hypothetical protein
VFAQDLMSLQKEERDGVLSRVKYIEGALKQQKVKGIVGTFLTIPFLRLIVSKMFEKSSL